MAVLLMGWAVVGLALPCVLAFLASYYRKPRLMKIMIALLVLYTVVMIAALLSRIIGQPLTDDDKLWGTVYAMLLMFGSGGAGLGLLVGGLGGWLLRGRL